MRCEAAIGEVLVGERAAHQTRTHLRAAPRQIRRIPVMLACRPAAGGVHCHHGQFTSRTASLASPSTEGRGVRTARLVAERWACRLRHNAALRALQAGVAPIDVLHELRLEVAVAHAAMEAGARG